MVLQEHGTRVQSTPTGAMVDRRTAQKQDRGRAVAVIRPVLFFFSSRRRHTRYWRDWSSDVCSSDLFEVVGDLYAQAGSNAVGGARLLKMIEEFDLEGIESLSDEVCSRSEQAMRKAIAALPDGLYENEAYTDGFDEPIRLSVAVRVEGDEMYLDYDGSSRQSERGINVVLNYTAAYTTFGVKCAISPEVPNNDGSFRPIHVTAPEGCILNALYPAPVGARHIIGHFLPGLIHGALAQAIPERVLAQGADSLWNTQITGQREGGDPFTYVFFSGGGMGARSTGEGLSATAFPSGIRGVPAEVIESISPVIVHRRELQIGRASCRERV